MGISDTLVGSSGAMLLGAAFALSGCGWMDACDSENVVADHTALVVEGDFRSGDQDHHWDLKIEGDSVAQMTLQKGDSVFVVEFQIETNGTHLSAATE